MDVYYTDTAKRQLRKLERLIKERLVDKMRFFASHSDPLEFALPLTGYQAYRFRVGDYRVTFDPVDGVLRMLSVRRRDEAYRWFSPFPPNYIIILASAFGAGLS